MGLATARKRRPSPKPVCLLIEDLDFDVKRFDRVFSGAIPMDLHVATDLAQARAILTKTPINLIIMDNRLPDGLGVEFAFDLRKTARWSKTPIILVSDHPSPFLFDKAKDADISMVLTKDKFQPQHIRSALRSIRFARLEPHSKKLTSQSGSGAAPKH